MKPITTILFLLNLFAISDTALSQPAIALKSDSSSDSKPFEISFPLAGEFTVSHSAPTRFFFPAGWVSVRGKKIQLGISGALQGTKTPKGRLSFFSIYQLEDTTSSKKTSFAIIGEGGVIFESENQSHLRFGLGIGWLKFIGPEETPGIIHFNLLPILDVRNGKVGLGLTVNASAGVLIGKPKSAPEKGPSVRK